MASKSHLVLVCTVRGHEVRIKVPAGLYHLADARDLNGDLRLNKKNANARTAICIQVREAITKRTGKSPGFLVWRQLHIEVVAHINEDESIDDFEQNLTPHDAYRLQVARNLRKALDKHEAEQKAEQLSLFEVEASEMNADEICGCVPFPITKT